MRPQRGPLTFGDQLQVLCGQSNGASVPELTERFSTRQSVIQSTLDRRAHLESSPGAENTRNHSRLDKKPKIVHFAVQRTTNSELASRFGVNRRTIGRIKIDRTKIIQMDKNKVSLATRRNVYSRYSEYDARLV